MSLIVNSWDRARSRLTEPGKPNAVGTTLSSGRGFESCRAWQQERSSAVEHTKRASAMSQHLCRPSCFFTPNTSQSLNETPANAAWEYIGNQRGSNPAPCHPSARNGAAENSQQTLSPAFEQAEKPVVTNADGTTWFWTTRPWVRVPPAPLPVPAGPRWGP